MGSKAEKARRKERLEQKLAAKNEPSPPIPLPSVEPTPMPTFDAAKSLVKSIRSPLSTLNELDERIRRSATMLKQDQLFSRFFDRSSASSKSHHSVPVPVEGFGTYPRDRVSVKSDFGALVRLINLECELKLPSRGDIPSLLSGLASCVHLMRQLERPKVVAAVWIE